ARNQSEGRLVFTPAIGAAVEHGKVVFIAVGTPPGEDGSADLRHVLTVATTIGRHLTEPKVIVTKSTVPVGTAEKVRAAISAVTPGPFHVASNPEFLKEGAAIDDFMKPDRVVIGVDSDEARDILGQLYGPFVRTGNPILFMDIPSAEVTKYAANAMLATRISFMNQIAQLCEMVGADVGSVRKGIGTDRRIGPAFLFPGPGYGGSCFPKDVKALIQTARDIGMEPDLWESVEAVNDRQKRVMLAKLKAELGTSLAGRKVAVWGLAFKPETDDMRESPSIPLVEGILSAGGSVVAHDPKAAETAREVFGSRIQYARDPYEALAGADALAIVTEWLVYRNPDLERVRKALRNPLIVDGRNLFDPPRMAAAGFKYVSIGRRGQ
ncbi:MAG: UDP-glucose/GDP-mannose dehydrogenase family protein, partial [Gemmatimonadales bacterium]|nr:UDP-glucose/GDP-mannose dehydrogenase family protein [Gemmatimonadales bacterium]